MHKPVLMNDSLQKTYENIIQMATQANYCVTPYVLYHFVDFLAAKTLSFLITAASPLASTSLILGCPVVPWVYFRNVSWDK